MRVTAWDVYKRKMGLIRSGYVSDTEIGRLTRVILMGEVMAKANSILQVTRKDRLRNHVATRRRVLIYHAILHSYKY